MRWASSLSLTLEPDRAAEECVDRIRGALDGASPDLVFAFPAGRHAGATPAVGASLRAAFGDATLLGCTAAGVIGGGHEAEGTTALSVIAAVLPGVTIEPFRLEPDALPGPDVSPAVWRSVLGVAAGAKSFVVLADPFTSRADELLGGLDYAYPGCPKIGGLASASSAPGGNFLLLDDECLTDGTVGVALSGNVRMETIVSQGGRAVGPDLAVTRCDRNILFRLDDRPALEVLQEVHEQAMGDAPEDERSAFFVGIRTENSPGGEEFLIRNLLGADPSSGAIAVGGLLRAGQSVRFHVLSAESATEDLRRLLRDYRGRSGDDARGALLFTCNGRGQHLFGVPDHDSGLFRQELRADVPLGGLFCAGEIGPIGAGTYLHGFTSSFGILGPAREG